MFAILGDLEFELITYWSGLSSTYSTNYVEHPVIEGLPVLQNIGDNLEEITIKLQFHSSFCNPKKEMQKLRDMLNSKQPFEFVFGNGEYRGVFVIQEIQSEATQTLEDGTVISIFAEVKLKEYSFKKALEKKKQPEKKTKKTTKPKPKKSKTESTFEKGQIVRQK